jgi:hypothetical protein
MRNEWSNYTNWPYDSIPMNVQYFRTIAYDTSTATGMCWTLYELDDGHAYNPNGTTPGFVTRRV